MRPVGKLSEMLLINKYVLKAFKETKINIKCGVERVSQVALAVKNQPANADVRDAGRPLGQVDPLEEGPATHSSILVENPVDRGAGRATVRGVAKSQTRRR